MSHRQTQLHSTEQRSNRAHNPDQTVHSESHELTENWRWSDAFTEFIQSRIDGFSLKVCPGTRPIADVNLDIRDLREIAPESPTGFSVTELQASQTDSDPRLNRIYNALTDTAPRATVYGRITTTTDTDATPALYDGYAVTGDAFQLPFADGKFETVVADPPWLELSETERHTLFNEIVRVTAPLGQILYNATWIPSHEQTRQYDLRMRQQLDFWGGPSFAACYRRTPQDTDELFDAHEYESLDRYPDSAFWDEDFRPGAISAAHGTDPNCVSPRKDEYCCPQCSHPQLAQIRDPQFESLTGEYTLYECLSCNFRVPKDQLN